MSISWNVKIVYGTASILLESMLRTTLLLSKYTISSRIKQISYTLHVWKRYTSIKAGFLVCVESFYLTIFSKVTSIIIDGYAHNEWKNDTWFVSFAKKI